MTTCAARTLGYGGRCQCDVFDGVRAVGDLGGDDG